MRLSKDKYGFDLQKLGVQISVLVWTGPESLTHLLKSHPDSKDWLKHAQPNLYFRFKINSPSFKIHLLIY